MGQPRELAEDHVSHFLTYLAVKAHVAAPTQRQATTARFFFGSVGKG